MGRRSADLAGRRARRLRAARLRRHDRLGRAQPVDRRRRRERPPAAHRRRRQRPLAALVARRRPPGLRLRGRRDAAALRALDGQRPARAASRACSRRRPSVAWSPDGRWIAFTMFVAGRARARSPSCRRRPRARSGRRRRGRATGSSTAPTAAATCPTRLPPGLRAAGRRRHAAPAHRRALRPRRRRPGRPTAARSSSAPTAARTASSSRSTPRSTSVALDGGAIAAADRSPRARTASPPSRPTARDRLHRLRRPLPGLPGHAALRDEPRRRRRSAVLTEPLDRDVERPALEPPTASGLYFQYDDEGDTRIAFVDARRRGAPGWPTGVGGLSLGRPYAGGAFTRRARRPLRLHRHRRRSVPPTSPSAVHGAADGAPPHAAQRRPARPPARSARSRRSGTSPRFDGRRSRAGS